MALIKRVGISNILEGAAELQKMKLETLANGARMNGGRFRIWQNLSVYSLRLPSLNKLEKFFFLSNEV